MQPKSQQRYYVPTFHFSRSKPCFCRSGKLFGGCCGKAGEARQRPSGIQVYNNYLSTSECNRFIRFAEKQKREWLTVVDSEKSSGNKLVHKRHPSRITQHVDLKNKRSLASDWFLRACKEKLGQTRGLQPQWFEVPQLLRYGPGGKYGIHADADHFCHETQQFYRFIDRDFSMLIYLNDETTQIKLFLIQI